MSAPAAFAAAERRAPALNGVWLAAAALMALAVAVQLRLGMIADVAWLIHCNERWLDGAVPYRDFIEINPPASLLLYLAPVAAARALNLPAEALVSGFGFLSAAAALGVSALILRRPPPASVALAAIVALVVLPGETFCERDHLAAVFGTPLLALALARAEGRTVPLALALAAGIGAGLMAAIKPPYALIGLLLALYLVARIGWRAVLKAPEYYAATAIGLVYVACVGLFFPDYVAHVLPLGVAVYEPSREGVAALAVTPGAQLALLIVATAALTIRQRGLSPGFVIAALATLGAGVAYFIQGKGWVYQGVPAAMYATLAGGFALEGQARRAPALAVGALVAAAATPFVHNLGLGWGVGIAAGLAVEAARLRAFELAALGPVALAAAIGAACGVCTIERPPTPALERQLAALGPHLKLASVSEDMGLSFPLARRLGATWTLRRHSLFVASDVSRVLEKQPHNDALRRRLQPFADAERKEVLADLAANPPDAILVGPLATRLHAEIWADPGVQAVMANYRLAASEQQPGYAAQLWLRKDLAVKAGG